VNEFGVVGFEVFTAASMKMAVFWVVVPCNPDDGGSKDPRNVGELLPVYTALQPRSRSSSSSGILLRCPFSWKSRGRRRCSACCFAV
jgi:hypothetical protein